MGIRWDAVFGDIHFIFKSFHAPRATGTYFPLRPAKLSIREPFSHSSAPLLTEPYINDDVDVECAHKAVKS